jgi:hypothetical protein
MPKPVKTAAYKRPRIHSGDGRPLAEQEVEEPDEHRDDADGEAGEQEGVAKAAPFLGPSHQLVAPVFQGCNMVGVCSGPRATHWASANPATTVTPSWEFRTHA